MSISRIKSIRRIVIQIVKYLLNDRRVFDTGESLPRERSECFGYDPGITTAFTAGFTKSRCP